MVGKLELITCRFEQKVGRFRLIVRKFERIVGSMDEWCADSSKKWENLSE